MPAREVVRRPCLGPRGRRPPQPGEEAGQQRQGHHRIRAAPVRRQVSQALGQQRHPHSALVVLQQIEHTALGGKETTAAVAVEPPQRTGISAQQTVGRTRPVAALAVGQYQCRTQAGAVGPPRAADPVLRIDAIESVVLAADPDRAIRIAAHPQHAQRAKLPRRHRLEPMAVPALL
ncbi:hypothetical protein G6F24_014508 [Rhizopus arrhizus]|nr:hypothetical protein G6F24_014508 [Rhizopus arrhizus]